MISPWPMTTGTTEVLDPIHSTVRSHGLHEPPAPRVTRQFRRLITNMTREFPAELGGTLLLCGVGSSAHIANVATHTARQLAVQCHAPVTLVDANVERHVLTTQMAADNVVGLVEVLRNQGSLHDALRSTDLPSVSFLPSGGVGQDSDDVASDMVRNMLRQLRQACRYAIIAAPDRASRLQTLLGRHCDGTYLVVQLGTAERAETSQLSERLAHAGARLMGCVVTGAV
jgi:Mrp family chromosome partitioning ATPase